jgi:hypothetical protein
MKHETRQRKHTTKVFPALRGRDWLVDRMLIKDPSWAFLRALGQPTPKAKCYHLIGENRYLLLWGEGALKPLWILFLVLVIHH